MALPLVRSRDTSTHSRYCKHHIMRFSNRKVILKTIHIFFSYYLFINYFIMVLISEIDKTSKFLIVKVTI